VPRGGAFLLRLGLQNFCLVGSIGRERHLASHDRNSGIVYFAGLMF
jgi:hypothetical protein